MTNPVFRLKRCLRTWIPDMVRQPTQPRVMSVFQSHELRRPARQINGGQTSLRSMCRAIRQRAVERCSRLVDFLTLSWQQSLRGENTCHDRHANAGYHKR